MYIYLFVFLFSTLFYYWGTRKKRAMRYFFYGVAILIPSILAGCRDLNIGTDMGVYAVRVWDVTCGSQSLREAIMYMPIIEPMYIGLNYVVSLFTDDMHWFLFFHMAILMTFTVFTAHKYRKTNMSWILVAFFLLYFYNASLNLMRQSIAVLIVFYGCTFLQEKKILKFYLCVIVAYFAHHSAIFVALLYPVVLIINRFKNQKAALFVCVAGGTLAIMSLYRVLMGNAISMGLLDNKYENYLEQEGFRSHKMDLLVIGILAVGVIWIARKIINNININNAIFLLVIAFCVTLMGDIVEVANRVASYLLFLPIVYIITALNTRGAKMGFAWLLMFLLLVRWFYGASNGYVDTVPYTSMILGIS